MKRIILVFMVVLMSNLAWAESGSIASQQRELAAQLVTALKIGQKMQEQFDKMKEYYTDMIKQNSSSGSENDDAARMSEEYNTMMKKMTETMNWDKIQGDYIEAVAEVFTTEELQGLVGFFSSPVGQSSIDKVEVLGTKLMEVWMKQMEVVYASQTPDFSAEQKGVLRTLSTAAETYATVNSGRYPSSMSELTDANPPYMIKDYCGAEISGYRITCEMTEAAYKFTATPTGDTSDGRKVLTIRTGGILE